MSGERLTGSEKRALLFWVMVGIAGALFARHYFFRAFPEASVDFRVSRDEALSRARRFVNGLGEDASRYQSAIIFDVDDNAKTYLERELGLQQARGWSCRSPGSSSAPAATSTLDLVRAALR